MTLTFLFFFLLAHKNVNISMLKFFYILLIKAESVEWYARCSVSVTLCIKWKWKIKRKCEFSFSNSNGVCSGVSFVWHRRTTSTQILFFYFIFLSNRTTSILLYVFCIGMNRIFNFHYIHYYIHTLIFAHTYTKCGVFGKIGSHFFFMNMFTQIIYIYLYILCKNINLHLCRFIF